MHMDEYSADKEVKDLEAACLVFNLRSSAQSEDEEGGRPQMSLKQYNPDARNLVISRELPMKNSPQMSQMDADKEVRNLEAACLVFNLRMKKGGGVPK